MKISASELDTMEILKSLVSIQSDTNSRLEINIEEKIVSYISSIPYFNETKNFGLERIPHDGLERNVVWALFKQKEDSNKNTIVFLNHHDAVDDNDYGILREFSRDNANLKSALAKLSFREEILQDLKSENWFFSRGAADMKAGIAIQLKLLEELSLTFDKNILFLSVPDEETLSLGMRHSAKLLKSFKEKYGLEYTIVINSEPHSREKEEIPVIYEGSVGKTMIAIYIKGKKAHIGDIFHGLNPSLILSNIILRTELNAGLADHSKGEYSPPPTWSFARDFKECYDASIPESAGGYLSFLTLSKSPKEILSIVRKICEDSFKASIQHYKENFSACNINLLPEEYDVNVLFYEELLTKLSDFDKEKTKEILKNSYASISKKISDGEISLPESNFEILDALCNQLPNKNPIIVIAISPPYYPHVHNNNFDIELASQVEKKQYFMGISDLSYVSIEDFEDTAPYIKNNMPLWREEFYTIPFDDINSLSIPVVNIGPWGKDLHKLTERVFVPDVNKNTSELIKELINKLYD